MFLWGVPGGAPRTPRVRPVYEQCLSDTDRLRLTENHAEHDGDTTFPVFDEADWQETERERHGEFDFVTYERQ